MGMSVQLSDMLNEINLESLPKPTNDIVELFDTMKQRNRVRKSYNLDGVLFIVMEPYTISIVRISRQTKAKGLVEIIRVGLAICVDGDNFCVDIGKNIAFANAFNNK